MSGRVNLLPPEVLQGLRVKRTTGVILLGGAMVLVLIVAFYFLQVGKLGSVNDQITAQEANNRTIQSDINDLKPYEDLQTQAQKAEASLASAYANETSFSGMLMDLSRVTPPDSYLTSFTVQISGVPADGSSTFVGTMQLGGEAIGYDTIATWLTRLEQVTGWVNPWIPSVSLAEPTIDAQTFSASVDLTTDALTARGRGQGAGK